MIEQRYFHKTRPSYIQYAEHINDDIKNSGYDYKGKQFKNSLSKYLYEDPIKEDIFAQFENMIYFLTEYVKMIKKTFNYAIDKNLTTFN